MIDFEAAEELFGNLAELTDLPIYEPTPRLELARTLAVTSLHHGAAVRLLCGSELSIPAAACLRSQFEANVRAVWSMHCASEQMIERLSEPLSIENALLNQSIPLLSEMMGSLEKVPACLNLMIALNEFRDSSWKPLNSFVHSGTHAIHWTRYRAPESQLSQIFKASNGLMLLAFQTLAILTGASILQQDLFERTRAYPQLFNPLRNA